MSSAGGKTRFAVRLRGVTKKFGSFAAVDQLSLHIPEGSVYGLIGPNGAGKTTTFSMMAGFLSPSVGEVELLGHSPKDVEALRSRLGVLPQDAILPPRDRVGDLLSHLALLQGIARPAVQESVRFVLAEVGGADWWKTRCGELSHGMAKRVQLAQALLGDPAVILLDEPTAGLDPRVAYEVREIIKGRRGKATLIVSSHNLHELEEICDRAAILDHGRLVASGTMAELTGAAHQLRFSLAPPRAASTLARAEPVALQAPPELPLSELGEITGVSRVELITAEQVLLVHFAPDKRAAEDVLMEVAQCLFSRGVRIREITRGQGLERRVMDLTQ